MKKMWLTLIGMTMAFSASAMQFSEGTQYIKLDRPVAGEPQVVEFFSFYCPHCNDFEHVYHVSKNVKKALPEGTTMARYHVEFLGPLGKPLSQAWAVAIALNVEDQVSPLMFEAVQKTKTVKNTDDIRNIFVKAGVNAEDYEAAWNSFAVKSLVEQQKKTAEALQLRGVPAVFVNGKYRVKNDGLNTRAKDTYAKEYADVVNFLVKQK